MKCSYNTLEKRKKKKKSEKRRLGAPTEISLFSNPGFHQFFFLYSFLLSWFTTRNEQKTTAAPIQYMALEYWPCRKIWAMRDRGIVKLRPTVTTRGVVRSIAYAQQMSEASEVAELT